MYIQPRAYMNILELYMTNHEFRLAFDQDKGRPNRKNGESLIDYMDDYSDRPGIVDGVLADIMGGENYKWKISTHRHWRDQTITITEK